MEFDFETGEVLLIDKPYGWTSFQVANFIKHRTKRITGNKKLKVGHAGTLDPLATGLLILCTGKKTKQIDQIQAAIKGYKGTIYLGAETASYDLESKVKPTNEHQIPTWESLQEASAFFLGKQNQVPPQFSAKKINGKRAYESARKGEIIEMRSNEVELFRFELSNYNYPQVDFEVICSKGTYIRSLAYDLGKRLGCGGFLAALRRTQIGDYEVKNALKIKELKIMLDKA